MKGTPAGDRKTISRKDGVGGAERRHREGKTVRREHEDKRKLGSGGGALEIWLRVGEVFAKWE